MPRSHVYLLVLVPLALIGRQLGFPDTVVFFISLGAIVPLAGFIAIATDEAALVKATLVGAIISNTALIVGLAFLAAGIRHGLPGLMLGQWADTRP